MSQASDLLERIGETALPVLGDPGAQVPAARLAREAWGDWVRSHEPEKRPAILAELRALDGPALSSMVGAVVKRLLPGRTGAAQAGLSRYLAALPSLLRWRGGRSLETAEDLSRWLPSALPRFSPGDAPAGVGDRRLVSLIRIDPRGEFWLADNPRLPDRPAVVLAFLDDARFAERLLAWHQRVQRGGPVAALLPPEHTFLNAASPCVQFAPPPGETLAALCREPGAAH
ncbi:MAG: hypothetical protein K2W96_14695, partial [Gemmataceae bacterium]|nr:hypothetical protein [Gemmataceae bacterium]